MLPSVAVVLVNWNLADDTIATAHSVLASQGVAPTLIVVDNGSTDNSAQQIRAALTVAHVLLSPTNRGYASGANVGLRWALDRELDYVLLLNNDTILDPNCLARLVDALEREPGAGIAGPLILHADEPQRIWYLADRESPLLPVPISLGRGQIDRGQFARSMAVDYVSGCAMLIRRAVLEEVGLLEERLFMHYEDADFCWRVRRAGFSIHGVPDARLWHKVSQSGRQLGPHITYYRTRNRIWFYATHRRGLARLWALAYVIPHEMARCSRAMLNDDHDVAASCWKGIRHGLRGQLGK